MGSVKIGKGGARNGCYGHREKQHLLPWWAAFCLFTLALFLTPFSLFLFFFSLFSLIFKLVFWLNNSVD